MIDDAIYSGINTRAKIDYLLYNNIADIPDLGECQLKYNNMGKILRLHIIAAYINTWVCNKLTEPPFGWEPKVSVNLIVLNVYFIIII